MRAFYVSEADAVILKQVVQEHRRRDRAINEAPRHPFGIEEMTGYPSDDIFPPEVYVAEIPETGIPAMTVDGSTYTPGKADCDIYKLWPNTSLDDLKLIKVDYFTKTVYNLTLSIIDRSGTQKFILIWRDKYGHWIAKELAQPFMIGTVKSTITAGSSGTVIRCDQTWVPTADEYTVLNPHDVDLITDYRVRWARYPGWTSWVVEPWHFTECQ